MISAKLRVLPAVLLLLPLDALVACVILAADLATIPLRMRRRGPRVFPPADLSSVTIQILNWDGKHLLEECIPSVLEAVARYIALAGGSCRVVVVDNGSTDGSVEFLQRRFPDVSVLKLDRNYGFSKGNNRGLLSADTDVVVLLNNDMRVHPDFLQPLLEPFSDPNVFAAASQIRFADSSRRREETGKTRARFDRGFLYLWHDEIAASEENGPPLPVFWAGGGSCAVDRRKLMSFGGLDALYHPFYVEDADMSYQAWKRGWKCLLAARSSVVHRHRGTSRPRFGDGFVDNTIRRNQFLFIWKNVSDFSMILRHLAALPRIHGSAAMQYGMRFELRAYIRAVARLPYAVVRRAAGLREYVVGDSEMLKAD